MRQHRSVAKDEKKSYFSIWSALFLLEPGPTTVYPCESQQMKGTLETTFYGQTTSRLVRGAQRWSEMVSKVPLSPLLLFVCDIL